MDRSRIRGGEGGERKRKVGKGLEQSEYKKNSFGGRGGSRRGKKGENSGGGKRGRIQSRGRKKGNQNSFQKPKEGKAFFLRKKTRKEL